MNYRPTIGLEVHVQLDTKSKMFCGCSAGYGAPPNTHVCPVCLGYPGAMPVMNEEAVRLTVLTGLMIGSTISPLSKFDRKSYFYPDMPKNYQISQYDEPLCLGGAVTITTGGTARAVKVTRIHLEEDVAKNMHFESSSGVDFNRAGVPLMEIVSAPDLTSPEEAFDYLLALKQILQYAGVSRCNLEEGNVRCDVNISLRPEGQAALGTKTEMKNLNTFKGVLNALKYEILRQAEVLRAGGRIRQETRRWDADAGLTYEMRSKEDAHDYRYFPEPDLVPVRLAAERVAAWHAQRPELPATRRARYVGQYGLPEYDAGVLVADKAVSEFFEATVARGADAKAASNWIMTDLLRLLSERAIELAACRATPEALAGLICLVESRTLNMPTAREVFTELFDLGGDPAQIVKEKGLAQVSDDSALDRWVDEAIAANPKSAADFKAGKIVAAKHLVGQVMKLSRGKANPQRVGELIASRLADKS